MYKIILILLANFILPNQWVNINSESASEPQINLLSSNSDNIQIEFELAGFYLKDVSVNNKNYNIVSMPQGAANLDYGMPDVSHFSRSVIIPDDGLMNIEVLESEYIEYRNILIAPSKGNLSRTVNPDLVNYFFNDIPIQRSCFSIVAILTIFFISIAIIYAFFMHLLIVIYIFKIIY